MRVLLISHTCQSPAEGQPKSELLHLMPGITLRVLIPDRWKHYGKWRPVAYLPGARANYIVGKVRWPSLGPALFYMHTYARLRRILTEFKPDVIDLWEEPWSLVSAHTCYLRNKYLPQTKIISETEQNIFRKLPPPFENFRRYTIASADFVIGRSTEAVDVMRRHGYTGPAATVPNGVDANMFSMITNAQATEDSASRQVYPAGPNQSATTPSSPNSLSEAERSVSLRPPQASRLIKGDAAGISPVSLSAATPSSPNSDSLPQQSRRLGITPKPSSSVAEETPNSSDHCPVSPLPAMPGHAPAVSFTVGYAGRLVEEKGLGDLVAAIAQCPPQVKLQLIGDGPFKPALQQMIMEKQLQDRVSIQPGVPLAQLPAWMRSLNVFALPSRTTPTWKEQFGRVIIEAHACGIPVIGSDSGAIPEVIGQGGLVAKEGDPQSLADAIKTLAAAPARAAAMGRLGRKRVENWCSWEKIAEQMASIYKTVAG